MYLLLYLKYNRFPLGQMYSSFLCHFIIGWVIWDALWPNEFRLVSSVYSFLYNGSYMLPETVLTSAAAVIIYNISKKYDFEGHI